MNNKLIALGHANRMIGKRTLAWAKESSNDPRIPEALFIAAKANEPYKYGCNGWEDDEGLKDQLEKLLL
jgi:hypothetical protein